MGEKKVWVCYSYAKYKSLPSEATINFLHAKLPLACILATGRMKRLHAWGLILYHYLICQKWKKRLYNGDLNLHTHPCNTSIVLYSKLWNWRFLLNSCERHTYCQSEVLPVTVKHEQWALLKLFLMMCASIKALLHDIEDSFNAGYLVLVFRQRVF